MTNAAGKKQWPPLSYIAIISVTDLFEALSISTPCPQGTLDLPDSLLHFPFWRFQFSASVKISKSFGHHLNSVICQSRSILKSITHFIRMGENSKDFLCWLTEFQLPTIRAISESKFRHSLTSKSPQESRRRSIEYWNLWIVPLDSKHFNYINISSISS